MVDLVFGWHFARVVHSNYVSGTRFRIPLLSVLEGRSVARYFFRTIGVATSYLAIHFFVCLFIASPISAEYWVRELIAIKEKLANSISSPRIIFLGGSNVLFGIDAKQVEETTGVHSLNMGLHAELRLDRVLSIARDVARRGDILVLAFEHTYYSCARESWDDWQLRNALAWDRSYFDNLPLVTRIAAIFTAGNPFLPFNIITSRLGSIVAPNAYSDRIQALAPTEVIWERYRSGKSETSGFAYSAYNVDDRGDIKNSAGKEFTGAGIPINEPDNVCPFAISIIADFVTRMKESGIRVFVAHAPYLIDGAAPAGWQESENNFSRDVGSMGTTILDGREELFLPRAYFFNSGYHLNQIGRHERTNRMIMDLRKLGIGKAQGPT
jgi:hypothetical protein